ncbi:MAG TPA: POTRA domain-containing protein [Vicinamibacterales bacterium]
MLRCVLILALATCAVLFHASSGEAQVGQPIVEIQLDEEGRVVNDPAVLRLIETRVGDRLAIRSVRETISHLMALGRYEDVRVESEPVGNGVRVTYVLMPRHPIDRIEFVGRTELSTDDLRRRITERFGNSPSTTRLNEVTEMLRLEYRRRGFPSAKLTPRLESTHDPDRSTLVIDVNPGPRARILDVRVTQVDAKERSTLAEVPDIRVGDVYDENEIGRKMQAWETRMRERGFYEARANQNASISEDGSVFLFLNLELGPMVRLVFEGDPLPSGEIDRLVPVRKEASADEDLLEDSQSMIETYLHSQGYRDATAMYTREERTGELVITFRIMRGPRYLVRSVMVTGNFVLLSHQLLPLVRLKEGDPFVRATLAIGVGQIENFYRSSGFTRPQIKATENVIAPEDPSNSDRLVNVVIAIVEGPRTEVRSVTFRGNMALSDTDLRKRIATAPGRVYSIAEVASDRDAIVQAYHDQGFESVVVTPQPMFAENDTRADVQFAIVEGPQIIVDHIIISGNQRISTETIEREITLRPGEPFGEAAVVQSRLNLRRLELFQRVQIDALAHSGETRRDVLVQVVESRSTTVDFSAGLEGGYFARPTGEGGLAEDRFEVTPRGSIQVTRRNLWGKNRTITLFTRVSLRTRDTQPDTVQLNPPEVIQSDYGFHEYRALASYREPRLFRTSADILVTGIVEQAFRPSFNFARRVVQAQIGNRLSDLYTVSGAYSFQRTHLFDIRASADEEPWLIDRLFPQVRISKFSGTMLRDSRDPSEALDPTRGTQVIATADVAARAIGSEVGFIKTYLQGFYYHQLPLQRRVVLALGARVGLAHGFDRDIPPSQVDGLPVTGGTINGLPASERFFAGGDTTVRGFALDRLGNEQTISPVTGFPTGGNSMVVLNSELRAHLFGAFHGIGFVDAGNVFPLASDVSFIDLRPAAGFGLAYKSQRIGLARIDLGFNLNPQEFVPGSRERRWVLHFLLGQPF